MDALYRRGKACAMEVLEDLPDAPSYTAVRTLLRILEGKGQVRHTQEGARYIYEPCVPRDKARRSVLENVLRNFFDGSREKLFAALLEPGKVSDAELKSLADMVARARKEGR
jgi:predicted transcriptional regulator